MKPISERINLTRDDGSFYAKGATIWRHPEKTSDCTVTAGYRVAVADPYVDGAAEEIAEALNAMPKVAAMRTEMEVAAHWLEEASRGDNRSNCTQMAEIAANLRRLL